MNRTHLAPRHAVGILFLLLSAGATNAQPAIGPSDPYKDVAAALGRFIEREAADKGIPAVSIALVEDQRIVWARGFGFADPVKNIPASAETVHRVGSVSKLFTDIAVMQLVERGALVLDAPITTYLPEFRPKNPSGKPITLRQLMAHRSGLVREPPVGHYFDPTGPTLAATIASLNETELVYEPESHTKYSNAAIAAVGYALETTRGELFGRYIKRSVLDPIGMASSDFELSPDLKKRLARGQMWTLDGRRFEAPDFPLGIGPAGNLYATVNDLGRFLSMLFSGGEGPGGRVLKAETLRSMWVPQFAKKGEKEGFGLGFHIGEKGGRLRVGHSGAAYGFATDLEALPDDNLGVAVVATKDCANGVASRIADLALDAMLALKAGKALPEFESTSDVEPELASRLDGRFARGDLRIDLARRQGKPFWETGIGRLEIRRLGDDLVPDTPFASFTAFDRKIRTQGDGILFGDEALERVEVPKPDPASERWAGLIGEYGWDHDVLYIAEKDGKLFALIEWFFSYPLEEVASDVFRFPDRGLYDHERLTFTRDASGRATRASLEGVVFPRRAIDGEDGSTFRITPTRSLDELREEAKLADPPEEHGDFREPDLVELTTLDPTIKLDIRYATTNNFLGTPFYSSSRAFLQRPAAEALLRAHRDLAGKGYGLLIHDAYRPWSVTKMFWDATPASGRGFVANPAKGSKHNRGCAVDLTLYDLKTGQPVPMVGGYDEFSGRSNPDYPGGTALQRWHRDLLRHAMESRDFSVNEVEWWHFDYKGWANYPILNQPFEDLKKD